MTAIFDIHVHSIFSDGAMTVREILAKAKKLRLSGISITDHDTFKGSIEALKTSKNSELIIIPGIEISTNYGHLIVLGLLELKYHSISELLDYVKENDGLIIVAHPFGKSLFFKYPIASAYDILKRVDAIECINGRTPLKNNAKAFALAGKIQKPCCGGSDAHILEEIGVALTVVEEDVESVDEFIRAVRKNAIKPIGGRRLTSILKSIILRKIRRVTLYKVFE